MKWYFGIASIIVLAAVSIGGPPILNEIRDNYEKNLIRSIDVAEASLLATASEGMQISIYAPQLIEADEGWQLSGVYVLEGIGEFQAQGAFRAQLIKDCEASQNAGCWSVAALNANGQELVRDGRQVATLKLWEAPAVASEDGSATEQDEDTLSDAAMDLGETSPDALAAGESTSVDDGKDMADASQATAPAEAVQSAVQAMTQSGQDVLQMAPGGNQLVLVIQQHLADAGFYNGPIDGLIGPRTRAAIRAYQQTHEMEEDGEISEFLLVHLNRTMKAQQAELGVDEGGANE